MDLTTELLDNAAFREAKRGYNTQEVDEFIEQVKAEYGQHDAMVRESKQRIEAAEARVADAERRAAEATERAAATSDDDDTLKRTLILAQRTADAAIKEADEQAARTLAAAQDQSARMLADAQEATARARAEAETEARTAQEEARARVLAELNDLEGARDQLKADVEALDTHVAAQRDRVRLASAELQRVLDDPAALRETSAPTVSDVVVASPAPAALAEPEPLFVTEPVPVPAPEVDAAPEPAPEPEATGPVTDLTAADAEPSADPPPSPAYADAAPASAPSTETIDLVEEPETDDAYLAELRKAMTDEAPLGPREEGDVDPLYDSGADPSRTRFGRRR